MGGKFLGEKARSNNYCEGKFARTNEVKRWMHFERFIYATGMYVIHPHSLDSILFV